VDPLQIVFVGVLFSEMAENNRMFLEKNSENKKKEKPYLEGCLRSLSENIKKQGI